MIAADRTLLVLLAAGQSTRFGTADKLAVEVGGKALALHPVAALADINFIDRVAVVAGTRVDFAAHGYRTVTNFAPELGLSGSLRLGVQVAQNMGAAALLVALADMPCVTPAHFAALLAAADGARAIIASCDGARAMPPAVFGAGQFTALARVMGDNGGRALLQNARKIAAPAGSLVDIDTPSDLAALRRDR
ncbi:MAG: NTP transferase domain-containing protein [Sphingomonas sp.]